MARVIVRVEWRPTALKGKGAHVAVCAVIPCTLGRDGGRWHGQEHAVKAGAEEEARWHREAHRKAQLPEVTTR